jgi:hypothetical protein
MKKDTTKTGPIKCHCCGDTKQVEGIDGEMRPCSRCQIAAFNDWSNSRRPGKKADLNVIGGAA